MLTGGGSAYGCSSAAQRTLDTQCSRLRKMTVSRISEVLCTRYGERHRDGTLFNAYPDRPLAGRTTQSSETRPCRRGT